MSSDKTFKLVSEDLVPIKPNQARLDIIAAWRAILCKVLSQSITTTQLAVLMDMETRAAYLSAKAMAKEGLVSIISPDKRGKPCTIIINEKVRFFKK